MKNYPPAAPRKRLRDRLRSAIRLIPTLSMYAIDIQKVSKREPLDTIESENKKTQTMTQNDS